MRQRRSSTAEAGATATARRHQLTWRSAFLLVLSVGVIFALSAFAGSGAAMTSAEGTAPWIASDKADYAPGSTVHLTGGNWQPGEAVHVVTNDTIGNTWSKSDDVTADATGAIADDVVLPNFFVSDYTVTATGSESGTATTAFTDAGSLTLAPSSGLVGSTVTVSTGGGEFSGGATNIGVYWNGQQNTTNGTLVATCSTNNGGNIVSGCSFTVPAGSTVGTHTVAATQISDLARSVANGFAVTAPACTAASVTTNPANQSITYGADAAFTAAGAGSPAPTAQWQVSTDNGGTFNDIAGATGTTLALTKPVVAASGNRYRAVFTNTCNGTKTATTSAATLTVARKAITVTPNAGQGKVYGASDPTLAFAGSPALESGDSFTGGLSRAAGENVGSYAISLGTLSAGSNYNITLSAAPVSFAITAKPVTVTAQDKSKIYGDADPAFTFLVSGLVGSDSLTGVSCVVTGAHGNAGPYPITCSGNTNGNYAATYVAGTLTVDAKAASVTAHDKSKLYGQPDPGYTFDTSGVLSGDALSDVTCGVAAAHANVGSYPITCSGNTNGNYAVTYVAGTLTVNPKSATVTADDQSKTYGAADPGFSFQVAGLESGDSLADVSCGVAGVHANAGSYDIVCSGNTNGNYVVAYAKGTLTVHPKAVTVTADDKSKTYGSGDPSFTFDVAGLESGDSLAGVSCDVTGGHANVGSYPITCSGNTNGNYVASYVAGTLTVNAKPVTVTADDRSKTYGSGDPSFGFQVEGLEPGDSLAGVSCDVTGAHANAGTYPITCSGNTNGNYVADLCCGHADRQPEAGDGDGG